MKCKYSVLFYIPYCYLRPLDLRKFLIISTYSHIMILQIWFRYMFKHCNFINININIKNYVRNSRHNYVFNV